MSNTKTTKKPSAKTAATKTAAAKKPAAKPAKAAGAEPKAKKCSEIDAAAKFLFDSSTDAVAKQSAVWNDDDCSTAAL